MNARAIVGFAFRAWCCAMLAGAAAPAPAGQDASVPAPAIVIERGEHCIAPAAEMRRNHPDMLRHQRDLTLRRGERGSPVSLNRCIECHASRSNGSVLGSDRNFCQGCHRYAAVSIDCFECHQAAPASARTSAAAVESPR